MMFYRAAYRNTRIFCQVEDRRRQLVDIAAVAKRHFDAGRKDDIGNFFINYGMIRHAMQAHFSFMITWPKV